MNLEDVHKSTSVKTVLATVYALLAINGTIDFLITSINNKT